MFDFSFSEIALIGVVALVVIGPERLPKVARTAGVVMGRVKRYAAAVRADIAREVELSELRQAHQELQEAAKSIESGIQNTVISAESSLIEAHDHVMTPVSHPLEQHESEPSGAATSTLASAVPDEHATPVSENRG